MRRNPKITFIGAGSTVFMKNIIGDVLHRPALKGATIALMDINPERLAESEIVAGKLAKTLNAPAKVETYHLHNIISYLAQKDPEAALKLSLESTSTQQQQQGVAAAFAQFARADPDAAKQRLSSLPPGPMHDSALSAIASSWGQTDSTAAIDAITFPSYSHTHTNILTESRLPWVVRCFVLYLHHFC